MRKTRWPYAAGGVALLAVGACGSDKPKSGGAVASSTTVSVPASIGKGEGALNLIAWAGYAESGQTDAKVDWVTPFQAKTGCKVNVKIGNTSDEMVQLMRTGEYDGVSASGDATLRLIAAGDVAAVNPALVPNYADVSPFLKMTQYNSKNGVAYGIPHGWGANLLMYNTQVVNPAPDSWGVVFDANSPYKGKVTAYDAPISLADGALYLMKSKPDLGIKSPYALDRSQFDATVALMKTQHSIIGEYWSDYTKAQAAAEQGTTVLGTTWQYIVNLAKGDKATVEAVLPKEGATAWTDTWMIASKAKNPNCMYMWFDWITSPEVQAQVAEWFGEAPANPKACALTSDKTFCDTYKTTDEAFHEQLWYWTTPTEECLDGRTDKKCVPFADWQKAWTEIKG
jgi:putative spermidine/putrescine transport system substrate-binding protein